MIDYLFNTLNDKEFEILVCDLLSREFKTRIERFKAGKDGGIDGRFFSDKKETVIIQIKHYSDFSNLKSKLKNSELEKVKVLNPSRYIVVTSLPLSPKNKDEIKTIFEGYIQSTADIWGREGLNDLIKEHEDIKKHHPKLWLNSVTDIQNLLFNSTLGRSEEMLKDMSKQLQIYHYTSSHKEARDIIDKNKVLIVTGMPGIGKTTLAKQISYEYSSQGFELFDIHNIKEAEDLFINEKRQLFYFDDFLGSNLLEVLEKNEDSHVVKFIKRIHQSSNKCFILTSRSNILSQGKQLSEKFSQENINQHEFEVQITSLKKKDKAVILYNHMYFSALKSEFIDEIYHEQRYKQIIAHRNFNPRLISLITDTQKLKDKNKKEYWDFIHQSLENPREIWRGAIENQTTEVGKHIIVALSLNNDSIDKEFMQELVIRIRETFKIQHESFDSIIKPLVGSLLNQNIYNKKRVTFELFDPSVTDFVYNEYMSDWDYVVKLTLCLRTDSTLRHIKNMLKNEYISLSNYDCIIMKLIEYEEDNINIIDAFTAELTASLTKEHREQRNDLFRKIFETHTLQELFKRFKSKIYQFLDLAIVDDVIPDGFFNNAQVLENIILHTPDWYEFEYILEVVSCLEAQEVWEDAIKQAYISIIPYRVAEQASFNGVFNEMYSIDDNWDEAICEYIQDFHDTECLSFDLSDDDIWNIRCEIDEGEFIEENRNNAQDSANDVSFFENKELNVDNEDEFIDKLFERE